ncbi:signal recognition particle-docking protein FtsY [Craterilacuibacter sp. RT1T]|uniref:signal recognition particle-docking protein FtsY n=1 Tax=Craterilacuibacter sp. RT1T TaxID=2942211 RepID=UPI0020BD6557|nr:signal recognition particle-docking protein FtsY [Craterilacuibacter sp. RT1T]MCL6264016.1 signal recognition particle-docking protein FtsY [Craterilacuibacter sp. RT1T]
MFSFFKKKPPAPVETEVRNPTPTPEPTPALPAQESPIESATPSDHTAPPAPAPAVDTPATREPHTHTAAEPEAAPGIDHSPQKLGWKERLKAGLGIQSETPAPQPVAAAAQEAVAAEAIAQSPAQDEPATEPVITAPAEASEPVTTTIAAALTEDTPAPAPEVVEIAPVTQAEATPATLPAAPEAAPVEQAVPTPTIIPPQAVAEAKKSSWTERLKAGLAKTRSKLGKSLAALFGGGKIDEELYEELEAVLLTADMGIAATTHLLDDVRERVSLKGLKDAAELKGTLKDSISELITPLEKPLDISGKKPFVIMLAGVNGAGKTTSIGKLAKYYQDQGKSVLLAAGDTFRAAAREQLIAWGERNNVTVIAQQGGDSAAVCFDAIQAAMARGIDVVLADTAGRLPTQLHLMEEIKKVKRVISKALPDAPHETILVLDANIGQNAVSQVMAFDDALALTGLILTKLDGTAKGGVIAAIASQRPIPLRFIGVGEGIDDLRPFKARDYVDALFD